MVTPANSLTGLSSAHTAGPADSDQRLRQVAGKLEATFLSEMLKYAGFGKPRESFGGGVGEDQFASLLRDTQADALAQRGGIGLAESIFHVLKERQNG